MSKATKLTAEELTGVQELQKKINQVLANIGNAEVVKSQMLASHAADQEEWKVLTSKLEEKYGTVNISLDDGSITEIPEDAVQDEEIVEKV
jgi:hypothetical protein